MYVADRTRSKRGGVVGSGLIMGEKKKRVHDYHEEIVLEDNEEGASVKVEPGPGASSSSSSSGARALKRERVSEHGFQNLGGRADDPIKISDSEDDDGEEGLSDFEKKRFLGEEEKERKSEEGKGCGGEKKHAVAESGSNDEGYDSLLSSLSESENAVTSDEDFQVDDDGNESHYYSSSDSSSYDDGERGGCRKMVKERVRKVESETESSGLVLIVLARPLVNLRFISWKQ